MALGGAAAGHGEYGLYAAHGHQHVVAGIEEGVHHYGELAVGAEGYHHVQPGQARQLGPNQHGAHARPRGLINRSGEVGVGQDGHIDVRVLGQHARGVQADGEVVHHQAVGAGVEGAHGVVAQSVHPVGDVEGVEGLLALHLVGPADGLHDGLHPGHQRAVRRVGHQLVVLDDVHAAHRGLIGQLGGLLGIEPGAGLNHVVQQRAVPDAQQLADALHAEFGPLELGQERGREAEVQQFDLARAGYIADDGAEHHGELGAEVGPGVSYPDDEVPLLRLARHPYLVRGGLVDAHQAAYAALADLGGLAGDLYPGAGGLLNRQGGGELHHIGGRFGAAVIRGYDKALPVDGLVHLHDDGVDKHKQNLRLFYGRRAPRGAPNDRSTSTDSSIFEQSSVGNI